MGRIVIIAVLGTSLAIASGVGLSAMQRADFFAPTQADWLTASRMVTPAAPAPARAPLVIEPIRASAPAPQLTVPETTKPDLVQTSAPAPTLTPLARPVVSVPAPVQVVAPVPRSLPKPTPEATSRVSTRQAPLREFVAPSHTHITKPTTELNAEAIDRVWFLGVFR